MDIIIIFQFSPVQSSSDQTECVKKEDRKDIQTKRGRDQKEDKQKNRNTTDKRDTEASSKV